MARIAQIFRYPVKGLSPEAMAKAEVTPGKCIPLDRAFALAHGSTQFDTVKPKFLPKTKFLMLARNERLAALRSRYLDESQELVIEREGKQVARGRLDLPVGRQMIEQFFEDHCLNLYCVSTLRLFQLSMCQSSFSKHHRVVFQHSLSSFHDRFHSQR